MEPEPAAVRRYLAHITDRVEAFGQVRSVYHDKRAGFPHVDLFIIDAVLGGTPRVVLLTVGCAFIERGTQERVELAMVLPETWPITPESLEKPELFWPFGWLRLIGHEMPKLIYGPLPGDVWRRNFRERLQREEPIGSILATQRFHCDPGHPRVPELADKVE